VNCATWRSTVGRSSVGAMTGRLSETSCWNFWQSACLKLVIDWDESRGGGEVHLKESVFLMGRDRK
jgi:hypothetical protein